jgi:hypothetical protein
MPQINKVTVVGQNVSGVKIFGATIFLKGSNAFIRQRLCLPLPLIFGEERKGFGLDFMGI